MDGQPSEFFFEWLAKVSLVAVSCFLPGRAKDLSAPRYMLRTVVLFWVNTRRVVVTSYRRSAQPIHGFGVTGFILDSGTLRIGPMCCLEMPARNYQFSSFNNPEQRDSQLLRDGSPTSYVIARFFV